MCFSTFHNRQRTLCNKRIELIISWLYPLVIVLLMLNIAVKYYSKEHIQEVQNMAIDSINSTMARQTAQSLYAAQIQARKPEDKQEHTQKSDQNSAVRPSYDQYIPSGSSSESLSGAASSESLAGAAVKSHTGADSGNPDSGEGIPAKDAPVADISADGSPEKEAAHGTEGAARGSGKPEEEEKCTANTDRVDAEIEALKKKRQQLEQQITGASDDPDKKQKLEKELQAVEQELKLKDNDSYRKQHTTFTNG